ncbi:TrkA family potassium uptake protein [Cellulomonas sp. NPDC089187]|uniref:potassium channel family protein n=1 Tax=Cellulomonas sp. NPDC089187 TaxID=3154970 RepID=UPI003442303E
MTGSLRAPGAQPAADPGDMDVRAVSGQVLVVGLGALGESVVRALDASGVSVLGVDRDGDRVEHLGLPAVHADATSATQLEGAGAFDSSAAIICLGSALGAAVFATGYLVDHHVRPVWVTARDARHGRVLRSVGADRVLHPDRDTALAITAAMLHPGADTLRASADRVVAIVPAPPELRGRHTLETARHLFGVDVLARIGHDGRPTPPAHWLEISPGDHLVVSGPDARVAGLRAWTTLSQLPGA